jgi:hypothetical protein
MSFGRHLRHQRRADDVSARYQIKLPQDTVSPSVRKVQLFRAHYGYY